MESELNVKRNRELVDERRDKVLLALKNNGTIKVSDLAEEFKVSLLTIRRDLQYLECNNKLKRYYGGASIIDEKPVTEEDEVTLYRRLIVKYASTFMDDGDIIFINSCPFALQMLSDIEDKRVIVITNNGKAMKIKHSPQISIILTGGELRDREEIMVGEFAINSLKRVSAKKSFIGCCGISLESGLTTEFMNEVHINQLMITRVTVASYLLIDHTMLGKNCSFMCSSLKHIKNVITDEKADEEIVANLREMGINVYQVSKKDFL